ncbi:MAG TPA: succinate dehydrogenase flavoprotein subunit [Desulfosporosinus sp.]|nr:succinate dehydrogenase flavoprotein subunit [Desulfosporosinus sp.]
MSKVIVVGGGLAGLMATIKMAEAGTHVDLFSLVPVKRSHSVCAQGGINGAVNTKGEGDSPWLHFDDTVYGGDFLANQPPVKAMCDEAPGIIHLMDRMGVMFSRTPEGLLDFRRFGGTKFCRTAFAGATTGQQLLYALDEQVRRYEVEGLVQKYEQWELLSTVLDGGTCKGIVAQDLRNMSIKSFAGDAVIIATGGPGAVFGKSTNSTICTGSAVSAMYQQGVKYANGEFIQIHPTAIPGDDKLRLMSESARGEGGRIWTYKDGKPWYFLEEMFPDYGNLVPRDIATRAIYEVVFDQGLGLNGENMVYLDLSHIDSEVLQRKLGGIIEIYEKFVGDDPKKVPMRIFPSVHYSMGGLWVDYDQMTNIPGLFAAGECEYQYHGANRLGANSLLSAIYGGMVAGPKVMEYIKKNKIQTASGNEPAFSQEKKLQDDKWAKILAMKGKENVYHLHKELGDIMTLNVTVIRFNDKLAETDVVIQELMKRWHNIGRSDNVEWGTQEGTFIRQLWNMMELARVITLGALRRNESRGGHYKPEYPERDDENFLKTTIADWKPSGPELSYDDVDVSLIPPRARHY